jgi:hypothetical protein
VKGKVQLAVPAPIQSVPEGHPRGSHEWGCPGHLRERALRSDPCHVSQLPQDLGRDDRTDARHLGEGRTRLSERTLEPELRVRDLLAQAPQLPDPSTNELGADGEVPFHHGQSCG